MNYEQRAEKIKKDLEIARERRNMAQGKLESLKSQRDSIIEEIRQAGSTPETIKDDLQKMADEIEEKLSICERLINENATN